jgi:histidyl-tRNA synthetase
VDIVGVQSQAADAEIVGLIVTALKRFGFPQFIVKINNRKLLTAIGQYAGLEGEALGDLYRSIDKFDKIGAEGVRGELTQRGIPPEVITRIMELVTARYPGLEQLDFLDEVLKTYPAAREAIAELRELSDHLSDAGVSLLNYEFDLTMVRGLGYYTGPIFETIITEPNLGSVTGGGRYDDLVGLFRGESVPTVGTSLGIERIIDLMDILNLYPAHIGGTVVQAFVAVFGEETREESTKLAAELRRGGVRTELYLQDKNVGKQMSYADKKGIPLVALLGSEEIANGAVKLKRLKDGQEVTVARAGAADAVKSLLG